MLQSLGGISHDLRRQQKVLLSRPPDSRHGDEFQRLKVEVVGVGSFEWVALHTYYYETFRVDDRLSAYVLHLLPI